MTSADPSAVQAAATATPVALAATIARAYGSPLVLVHAGDHASGERHELAVQAAMALETTGADPVVACEPGRPVELILGVTERDRPGLLVVGSGGKAGLKALGSVSERVAMRAHCSVLIVRPGAPRQS